jgi:uncharacterized protein
METGQDSKGHWQLAGFAVIAVAIAIAVPLSTSIAVHGIEAVKQNNRESIIVTGSARYPIASNLATWHLGVSAQERTPAAAIGALRPEIALVESFLASGGLPAAAISEPPLGIEKVYVSVRTGLKKPAYRQVPAWHVSQAFTVQTGQIDLLEQVASKVGDLLAAGTGVSVSRIEYLSTELTPAKFAALRLAVADARERATTIAQGLGAKLGDVKQTSLGVYQITARNSTDVSGYGIDNVTSRLKDVEAVVSVTFLINR